MLSKFRKYESKLFINIFTNVEYSTNIRKIEEYIFQGYNRLVGYFIRKHKIQNCSYDMYSIMINAVNSNRNTVKYFLSRLGKRKREACERGLVCACHQGYENIVDYFLKLKETRINWLQCLYFSYIKDKFGIMNYIYAKGPKFLKDEKVSNALRQNPEDYDDFTNILNSDSDEDD